MKAYKKGTKKNGIIGLAIMLVVSVLVVFGSDFADKQITKWETAKKDKENAKEEAGLKDGTYTAEDPDFDNSGYKGIVTMEVKGGKITALTYDCIDKEGKKKSQLSMDGSYVMTENGPKWHEQAEELAKYVIENQSVDGLTMDEEGKTDAISSVSINIKGFVNLVKDCLAQASGEEAGLKDGTYTAEDPDFDNSGYKGIVTMEVKGGKITALTYDCIDKEGKKKSQLSMDGSYVMTENGPKWHEQAEELAKYVIENQSVDGLTMDEEGKTDAISSVSINIKGFVNLVKDCLAQASGEEAGLKDGTYTAEDSDFDNSGYKGIVTMEVKGGKITALTYDCIDKEGKKKSQLSMDGSYVMTENGPKWHEQAEELAKYVIENQSVDGLTMDEEGKTDAISSVSINIKGFVNLVKDCLSQASEETANEGTVSELKDGTYTAEDADFDKSGYKGIVTMEVKGGKITALTYDCIDKEGKKKSQLSMDGSYVMTENGPKWHEQAEELAKYVIENQSVDGLTMDEEGKTDAISSVSINIKGFVNLVKDCLSQASGETANEGTASELKDGTYTAEDADFDKSGYKGIVTMEVKGGKITALTYDCIDKEGKKKSQLSMDGSYVMTENGPKWHEQAEELAKYVIENQSVDGLTMDEEGKTDAISSVSINIKGFVNLVKDCLSQASGETANEGTASELKDGTYTAEDADFDKSGYKGIVTMEVKGGKIATLTYDCIDKEGKKKSQLSMDGSYVMTENGPKWHEQAEELAKYVIENQSVDGLTMDEEGKTDAISSVSINIKGFVNLVKDCLSQAV